MTHGALRVYTGVATLLLSTACGEARGPAGDDTGGVGDAYRHPPVDGCTLVVIYSEVDEDDGSLDVAAMETWEYDAAGRLSRLDTGGRRLEDRATWTYDSQGCVIASDEGTLDADGLYQPTRAAEIVCDDRGFPTGGRETTLSNGVVLGWEGRTLDEGGLPVYATYRHYSDEGTLRTERTITDWEDGWWVARDLWIDEYLSVSERAERDENGNITAYVYDQVNSSYVPGHVAREYDEHDRLVLEELRHGGEAEYFDSRQTWEWSDTLHVPTDSWYDAEGSGTYVQHGVYDCTDAWPWSCTIDWSYDGALRSVTTLAWTCGGGP